MRKLFAITLLCAYLFNLAGYNLFFQYSINKADEKIIAQLDNNQYDDNQLVEVKIRLNLPYMSDGAGYERYDGDVEFGGVHYNYVKRKISQDTLYVLCIPNQSKTQLFKGSNKYLVNVNDVPSGKESNGSGSKKTISIDEFNHRPASYDFHFVMTSERQNKSYSSSLIPRLFNDSPIKPPRKLC
ncbi:MAG: hypothetical protein ABUT20_20275 [Bacteroidota bacterium]